MQLNYCYLKLEKNDNTAANTDNTCNTSNTLRAIAKALSLIQPEEITVNFL